MILEMILYTRKNCCLCQEMKEILRQVAGDYPMSVEEINVDSSPDLQEKHGNEVPVLFINGRKAFKYRVTISALEKKLKREIVSN